MNRNTKQWVATIAGLLAVVAILAGVWWIVTAGGTKHEYSVTANSSAKTATKDNSSSTHSSDTDALVACKRYANAKFPYGFEYSVWDTQIAQVGGNTRVVFHDAKIGNAYGAERTVQVHCTYGGGSVIDFSAM